MPAAYLTGATVPANTLGSNGDYYLDTTTADLYLKSAGSWSVAINTGEPSVQSNALCSIDEALAWLRMTHGTTVQVEDAEVLLALLINGVSEAVIGHTERQYFPETAGTKTFRYEGGGYIDISPYELRTITSVTMGGATLTASTGVGDGDYLAMPRNKTREGTYTYLTGRDYVKPYPIGSLFAPVLNERDVVIVGDWGMSAVPADVKLATLIAVADLYRNPEQSQSRGSGEFAISEFQGSPGAEDALPEGALKLLARFIRPKIA